MNKLLKIPLLGLLLLHTSLVLAYSGVQRLTDEELSDVAGKGFVNIGTSSANGIDFTRVNFGGQIDTQLNVSSLKLGQYGRSGYSQGADIDFSNLALGTVDQRTGAIVPFSIKDPYIEFAYKGNKVAGIRVGFGEAHGTFSADFNSFSGNFNFRMQGTGADLKQAACSSAAIACLGTLLTISDSQMYMADGSTVSYDNNRGAASSTRATYVGLPNGTRVGKLGQNGAPEPILLSLFSTGNCKLVDMGVCFPNGQFQSFKVGTADRPAKDIFLSMQSENIAWLNSRGEGVLANSGAFMNIPKTRNEFGVDVPPIVVNFLEKIGIPRQTTCFGNQAKGC